MYTVEDLKTQWPRPGVVEWIGLRPARRAAVRSVPEATLRAGVGLLGDHGKSEQSPVSTGKRAVTLLQAEHLPVIAALAGLDYVPPELLRRNLLVSGISLRSLHDRRFRVGGVLLEGSGECHPCSRMEEALGPGGYNAVRGHGGLTAWVLEDGVVRVGDRVVPV